MKRSSVGVRGVATLAALSASLSACAPSEKRETRELPATNTVKEPLTLPNEPRDSLEKFRARAKKQSKARIFLGTCVAWRNVSNELTVTVNPGIADPKTGDPYFVFSAHRPEGPRADKVLMNGPEVGDPSVITLAFKQKGAGIVAGIFDRKITKVESQGHGQYSPSDAETKTPVINTEIIDAPLDTTFVGFICGALREGTKMPEIYKIDPNNLPQDQNITQG